MPTETTPPSELTNEELIELLCQAHGRSLLYPDSKVQHDLANTCRTEVLRRLTATPPPREAALAAAREIVQDHIKPCENCFGNALPDVERAIVAIVSDSLNDAGEAMRRACIDYAKQVATDYAGAYSKTKLRDSLVANQTANEIAAGLETLKEVGK